MGRGEPGSLRAVALPTEHGGWGLTLEPVLLGMSVAPALPGLGVAAAALAAFLARRPLRLLSADLRRGRPQRRTSLAGWVVAACLAVMAAGLTSTALLASGPFWWPLAVAAPAAAWQVWSDFGRRSRQALAEAAGALAMGAAAPAICLAAGWEAAPAFGMWAVLTGRALPSVLTVRAQLRRGRGEPVRPRPAHAAHGTALAALVVLAAVGASPWAGAAAVAGLWAWAAISLRRPPVPARTLGWTQVVAGLLVVALTAVGHHLGW